MSAPSYHIASDERPTSGPDKSQRLKSYLTTLPTELLILITEALISSDTLNYYEEDSIYYEGKYVDEIPTPFPGVQATARLGSTCKRLHCIVDPIIMRDDMDHCYSSSLLLSAKRGSMEGVSKALAYGANVNTLDRTIFDSTFQGYLLDDGRTRSKLVRIPTRSSLTALHWAAFFGHTDMVAFLLHNGADANARADMGAQAWATSTSYVFDPFEHGHPQRTMLCPTQDDFELMWRRDNQPYEDCGDWIGASPLFLALRAVQDRGIESSWLRWGQRPMRPLFESGERSTKPVIGSDNMSIKPLVESDDSGCRLAIARMLIDAGASLTTRLRGSIHAIHQACAYRDYEVVRFLVRDLGVDVSITDRDGNSALHYMAMHSIYSPLVSTMGYIIPHPMERQKLILRLLLENGLDFGLKNKRGYTAKNMGFNIADDGKGLVEDHQPGYHHLYVRAATPSQMAGRGLARRRW